MKHFLFIISIFLFSCTTNPSLVYKDGNQIFDIYFAEWGKTMGDKCSVEIKGNHIKIFYKEGTISGLKEGDIMAEGEIMFHEKSGKWIISQNPEDAHALEVGGCSDGPLTIDFKNKIFWIC